MRKKITGEVFQQIVIFTGGIGMFLSTLDSGIINVALSELAQTFHATITNITWTISLYTLVLVGTIIVFGRLSDKYGRLNVYYWGLVIFLIASILCGFSSSLIELIGFRALQGIGAAMLQATAIAIVTTFIPKERLGQALGTMGVLIGLGPVLGPSIGGFLLTIGNWRWIFWINIPFVLIGMIGCRFLLKRIEESRNNIKLNIPGSLLLTLSILTLLQGVSLLASIGTVNGEVIRMCILFISLFTCFIFWEKKSKQPIIHLKHSDKASFLPQFSGYLSLVALLL